jgi:hypothetical protein
MAGIPAEIYVDLLEGVVDLLNMMTKGAFLQGTHEAALVEAQGAGWVGGSGNHLNDIVQARNAIVNKEEVIKKILTLIRGQNPAAAARLKDLLEQNLFRHSRVLKDTITQTEQMALQLRTTEGQRLAGVKFFEGGGGANVGRTVASLPSEQLKTPALQSQLRAGVEPSIVPRAHPLAQRTVGLIRQLPVTFEDVKRNIAQITGSILTAIRIWVSEFVAQASAAARVAMFALEAALVRFGSSLSTPLIFIGGSWRQPKPDEA